MRFTAAEKQELILLVDRSGLSCPTRIRTSTNRTKICRTAIILSGNPSLKRECKNKDCRPHSKIEIDLPVQDPDETPPGTRNISLANLRHAIALFVLHL